MCAWSFTKLQRVSPNFIMFENLFFETCHNAFKFGLVAMSYSFGSGLYNLNINQTFFIQNLQSKHNSYLLVKA
jgi:hypothetical protein